MASVTGVRFRVGSTACGCCASAAAASITTGRLKTVDFQSRLNIDVLPLIAQTRIVELQIHRSQESARSRFCDASLRFQGRDYSQSAAPLPMK
jgi:hypothetical protein